MGRPRKQHVGLNLPKRVYLERNTYWYRDISGARVRLGRTYDGMMAAHKKLATHDVHAIGHWDDWAKRLLAHTVKNAKTRNIAVALTVDDVKAMLVACNGRCSVSGVRFSWAAAGNGSSRHPWIPSLDRIDASLGYTIENCRVVCVAVNYALNEFGDDVLLQIAAGMIRKLATAAEMASNRESILQNDVYSADPPEEGA